MFSEEDSQSLCLWQRAVFSSSTREGEKKGGSDAVAADSLRTRLARLEFEYYKSISSGNSQLHLSHPMQQCLDCYGTVVDDKKGINNFIGAVNTLTEGQKKESRDWQSVLTPDVVMKTPIVKTLLEKKSYEGEKMPLLKNCAHPQSERDPKQVEVVDPPRPEGSRSGPSQKSPPDGAFSKSTKTVSKFPYCRPSTNTAHSSDLSAMNSTCSVYNSVSSQGSSSSGRWKPQRNRKMEDSDFPSSFRKKPKLDHRFKRRGRKEEDEEEEEEEEERSFGSRGRSGKQESFITARDQFVINQQKRFGGSSGTVEHRQIQSVNSTSYGASKRSLGTRRTAGGKFVPPVKRDAEGDEFVGEVQARVGYGQGRGEGGGKASGKLPPELEGDERLRNIEPRMVELIMNEIMDQGAPVSWDDIAGLQFAKATIKEIVVWPMLRPDIFTGLRGPPKGILLFGPPGTGKTLIGKCIASQVMATFFSISASSLTSKWVGEGEKMVRALFAVARCYQPAVIFIDEIDSLLSQRSDSEHESSRRIKTEFLVQLDGATTNADDRLLVIGATNRPQEIDEAARRRLVKRLYIPLPDSSARLQIVTSLMRQQPFSLSEEELETICTQSDGYSGADMANLCREAAYGPVREAAESIQHISADEMRPVLFKDFDAALQVIRPSVSERDLNLYIEWNKQFGCGGK